MQETIKATYLQDGYSGKNGHGLTGWYRDLTIGEAKRMSYHGTLYFVDRSGKVRECRMNGAPKTWKTRPGCELSLKYGLKECFRVGGDERLPSEPVSASWQTRIVVKVKQEFQADAPAGVVADFVTEKEIA